MRSPTDPFDELLDYWFMHDWNRLQCLNTELSDLDLYDDGDIFSNDRLVLNDKALGSFELGKRQMLELAEKISVLLVHQYIKDAMLSVQPIGVRIMSRNTARSSVIQLRQKISPASLYANSTAYG